MSYSIERIEFFVRETGPARFASALGKAGQQGGGVAERVTSPLCHVRMILKDESGNQSFGCAADRLSVRWLDKRAGRSKGLKIRELGSLVEYAGQVYRKAAKFETPFQLWRQTHPQIMSEGKRREQEDLSSSFASALLERAMVDGVCRLAKRSFFAALGEDRLGIRPEQVHPGLGPMRFKDCLPSVPATLLHVRHTVGLFDPLTDEDWPRDKRLNDGLPETVADNIERYGIRYFKLKISGDVDKDLARLARIWEILPHQREPVVTLDANEAFDDLDVLETFVKRMEDEQLGLFQHIAFIEQPLHRRLALQPSASKSIRRINKIKRVIIDESDDHVTAFAEAHKLGYAGTSHKNCKGLFKSLMNLALAYQFGLDGDEVVMSGEDLQNLPIVPLHQDFAAVAALGLTHCERNGHHYNFGLSMLSEKDKRSVAEHHRDLYERREDEWFLRIRDGMVDCASLQGPGLGVRDEPDWASMLPLQQWLKQRYPA